MKIGNTKQMYVLHNPDIGIVKIGISENIDNRKRVLEMECGCDLVLIHKTAHLLNAELYERRAHDALKDKRRKGEWFNTTVDEAIDVVMRTVAGATQDPIIEKYNRGESITKLAEDNGVTRQAILLRLKRYGVYDKDGDIFEIHPESKAFARINKERAKENKPPMGKYNIEESITISEHEPFIDGEIPPKGTGGFKRIAQNLNFNGEWYQISFFKNGGFVYLYTRDRQKADDYIFNALR